MYCRSCKYHLRGSDTRCPECGAAFDPDDPETYFVHAPISPLQLGVRGVIGLVLMWIPFFIAGLFLVTPRPPAASWSIVVGVSAWTAAVGAVMIGLPVILAYIILRAR